MAFTKVPLPVEDSLAGRKRDRPHACGRASKRSKTAHATSAGVFSCFTLDGNDVNLHRRSAFSASRKDEVRKIRKKGACLRCRLLKRPCSGEDPCKTCIAAARAAAKSKALMWMECIRPSFQAVNIFEQGSNALDQSRINSIIDDLLNDDVYLDFHIPFALNVEAASSHLARWLTADEANPSFSVVGVFSCSTNTSLIQNALDPSLGRDLRLFVHLTTHLYTTDMQGGYREYSDEEIQSVRDCVGNRLLSALDPLVRPSEIEASEDKLAKLRSLFLLLLGTIVGMRYTCSEVFEQSNARKTELELKQEALFRLLCHYLIYIGKATALLEKASDERTILQKWRTQWNKPAAFTWNPTQGLEMHYRIQPPSDFIVSSSEDESLSSIDVDLSEFDDLAQFTQDSDLLKCSVCESFWASLDANGLCLRCGSQDYYENGLSSASDATCLPLESSFSFDMFPNLEVDWLVEDHTTTEPRTLGVSFDSLETICAGNGTCSSMPSSQSELPDVQICLGPSDQPAPAPSGPTNRGAILPNTCRGHKIGHVETAREIDPILTRTESESSYNQTTPRPTAKLLNPFTNMLQASHPTVQVEELKWHCSRSFGTKAMGAYWVPSMLSLNGQMNMPFHTDEDRETMQYDECISMCEKDEVADACRNCSHFGHVVEKDDVATQLKLLI